MKVKLNNDQLLSLISTIGDALDNPSQLDRCACAYYEGDMHGLVRAALEELQLKLSQISVVRQKKYSLKLKPTWGFALRLVFAGRMDITTFEGITMMRICNDVHREYAFLINN